ncbi:hypothetical protein [Corallococcus macrosporus]|uniref:IPT/TIG domain-containing protein n=1 Tax=Corallococcus macrosporus DSM 14697 TaxID=1189310 RepID=A0A250K3C2_9BACT|nr:hypothetical protein [Corallococcus macrosporus]ATB50227.1 hypothetical protein MYMAC_005882 [Corallococcus macrosporus DSM 14697]
MRLPLAVTLLALTACSKEDVNLEIQVHGVVNPLHRVVTPARVCNAQGGAKGWRIEVTGAGFLPSYRYSATNELMVLPPEVTLRGATSITLPSSHVSNPSLEQLWVDVPTRDSENPMQLPPGLYSVEVSNDAGNRDALPDALQVVPPPHLTRLEPPPSGYSHLHDTPIVIEGTGFQPGTFPHVELRHASLSARPLGPVTVVSATRVETVVPHDANEGAYDVVLRNPEGCAAVLPQAVTITYKRLGALSVSPAVGLESENTRITLRTSPEPWGHAFSGTPTLFILAPLRAAPARMERIPLQDVTLLSDTEVSAVVPACTGLQAPPETAPGCPDGIATGGPYIIEAVDPGGASGRMLGFSVVPP